MPTPEILSDYDITSLTTFGLKAKAKWFASYKDLRELRLLARTQQFNEEEILHIGGGSNLLFDGDFNGLILHSEIKGIKIYRKDESTVYAIAGAGENWADFVDYCVDNGLGGLENLAMIPGEVGASAIQNVGAYGVEACDRIHRVECYDRLTGDIREFSNSECRFGYRDSIFKNEYRNRFFVLRVSFRLDPDTRAKHTGYGALRLLAERIGHELSISEVSAKLPDPKMIGSAGSFFKNPVVSREYYEKVILKRDPETPHYDAGDGMVKIPAGWLIDRCGLKGKSVGGAEVYEKQALVIVNKGNATASDILALCDVIRRAVRQRFTVTLHPEVNIIDTGIKATILGSGTSKGVPEIGCGCNVCRSEDSRDKRLRSSALVSTHGMNILIDSSPDFRRQALDADISFIDAVLFTHTHYDHVGGIDDLRVYTATDDLPLYMRPDVAADLRRRIDYCFKDETYPGVPSFRIHEIDEHKPFMISGLKITPIPVFHGKLPIVGYRIGDFAYITDASMIPEESMDLLRDLDVLIINSLRKTPHFAHFSLEESLAVIGQLKPRRAYLTHLCHEMGCHADVEKELPENVRIAYDGLVIQD